MNKALFLFLLGLFPVHLPAHVSQSWWNSALLAKAVALDRGFLLNMGEGKSTEI
jgi:hypothetical protein